MPNYSQSTYCYTKKRKDFGKQPLFQLVPGQVLDSINPDKRQQKSYCLRNPVHRQVQATLSQAEHDANTKQVIFHETGINHTEGGWPREIHTDNEDHVARHRRRVMHEDGYVHAVMSLSPQICHYLDQNNAINMYQTYFAEMNHQSPVETYNIREENVFRDPFNRPVSSIAWTNEKQAKLAVSYSHREWSPESFHEGSTACYLWNITRQTKPENEIVPNAPCGQLACSPCDPALLIAGLDNGTVNVFDIRTGTQPISCSSVFNSHLEPISALLYVHSRTNTEFFSGSLDGCCYWWDLRNLSKPLDQLIMSVNLSPGQQPMLSNAEGVSSLDFNSGLPTKFLCGTDTGLVINVNRMGREHSEIIASHWKAHPGAVRAVHRSPCTLRMFVTCGEYSVNIWSEEVRTAPIIVTRPYHHQVSDVAWAPLRYSCYMVVCQGGYLYYWDFLRKYREPVCLLKVSNQPLTKVCPHVDGHLVAVGGRKGSAYLMQVSENMALPGKNDKQLMSQTYERESRREHYLDARLREIHLKQRMQEKQEIQEPLSPNSSNLEIVDDEQIEAGAEQEYFRTVNEELLKMEDLAPHT